MGLKALFLFTPFSNLYLHLTFLKALDIGFPTLYASFESHIRDRVVEHLKRFRSDFEFVRRFESRCVFEAGTALPQ